MGWNAQPTRAVVFTDARVPVANRLGEEGNGFKIAMAGLDGGRLNIAACSLGGAQIALEKTLAYMNERKAFGKRAGRIPGAAIPARRHGYCARSIADVFVAGGGGARPQGRERHRSFAPWPSVSPPTPVLTSPTRRCSCTAATATCRNIGIEKIVRDLRVHQILEGTNEIMRLIIARSLVGR